MCYMCYEKAGKPVVVNEKTTRAAELIDKLYELQDCSSGGYAHIVTDDWNLDDASIDGCLKDAESGDLSHYVTKEGQAACIEALKALRELTVDERYSAMAIHEGFLERA